MDLNLFVDGTCHSLLPPLNGNCRVAPRSDRANKKKFSIRAPTRKSINSANSVAEPIRLANWENSVNYGIL